MQIDMPKYEVWTVAGGRWEDVSEKNFMETLVDIFDQVAPMNIFLCTCYHGLNINENPALCLFYLKIELSSNKLNFDFSLFLKILDLFEKKIIVVTRVIF
jgi:hypothetical protein